MVAASQLNIGENQMKGPFPFHLFFAVLSLVLLLVDAYIHRERALLSGGIAALALALTFV